MVHLKFMQMVHVQGQDHMAFVINALFSRNGKFCQFQKNNQHLTIWLVNKIFQWKQIKTRKEKEQEEEHHDDNNDDENGNCFAMGLFIFMSFF